ncbi:hypothetical protein [Marinicella gelatinilytica]|uniref:hypothetical protein n=1 Tax=Marinicella gelatinilytica TaxID=2996017 RepID=UPI002260E90C|nr:hypothetical protein [Marinicella gelatinilytica]MCX7545459.1 hypothetical protein [Marinicella gelatinilytica]
MFLTELCQSLEKYQVRYALVGGYAVALHGAVRGTVDIDFVINWKLEQLKAVETCLHDLGLVSQLPIDAEQLFHFKDEYINNRQLLAWHFYHPKDLSKQVDLIITFDLSNKKTLSKTVGTTTVQLLNKKDLITMKKQAARPQDLEDIKALKKLP